MTDAAQTISVIDTHTGGEPTRVVVGGGPDLGDGPLAERVECFRERHDAFRSAVVNEPRGSDVMVGALVCEPRDPTCSIGVIFFNNVGYIGMCGHGTIGLAVALAHAGRIAPGQHRIDTCVGAVTVDLHDANRVSLDNVVSYRHATEVVVNVGDFGPVVGDVAWGGNWFFLVGEHGESLAHERADDLTDVTMRIRRALVRRGVTGANGEEIDHVELFGPPVDPANDSRNFVLCPGGAYDRSPCGTGTSAKVACLAADGKLAPGEVWRQESIVGSVFEASYRDADKAGRIVPRITGTAHVNGESRLLVDPSDPFAWGIS